MPHAVIRERAGKLADYVNNGGNIISSFETSLYTETGKKLDDFRLKEVFGTDSSGDIFVPSTGITSHQGEKIIFLLKLPHKFINAPTYGLKQVQEVRSRCISANPCPEAIPVPRSFRIPLYD
jgi:hypothetical protein